MADEDPGKGMAFFNDAAGSMTDLTEDQKKAVADLKDEGMAQEGMGLPLIHPRIEILHQTTKQFRFVNTEVIKSVIHAIIVYVEPSRVWWEKSFADSDGGGMPDCFSRDLYAPDSSSGNKQADTCGACPKNQWESDTAEDGSPRKGKACKEIRRIFVIADGHLSPHVMTVPPTSLKALARHLVNVKDAKYDSLQQVVTVMKLVTKENAGGTPYSELALEVGGRVPEKWLALVAEEKARIRKMVETAAPVSQEEYKS